MGTHKLAIVIMFITSFVLSSCGGNSSTMIEVEGGTFTMGATHEVTVGSFMIGKYEVTQEFWESVMGNNPSKERGGNRPVDWVSWYDAIEFCNKLSEGEGLQKVYSGSGEDITCDFNSNGYRLPTEAEWEYAARGGKESKGYEYSGSNNLDEVAWYWNTSKGDIHDVGAKQPNELGLYDMSGNVWEWVWDWHGEYTSSSQTNPKGPNSGSRRVLRGGSVSSFTGGCRVVRRGHPDPRDRFGDYGLRLARTKN